MTAIPTAISEGPDMKTLLIAAALASTAIAGVAVAGQDTAPTTAGQGGRVGGMMAADANGDGRVDRAEFQARTDARFQRMDLDHDNRISPDERRHGPLRRPAAQGAAMRPTAGRTVDQAQFRRQSMRAFDRMDTNHDGVIDATELAAMRDLMRFRMAGRAGHGGQGGAMGGPGRSGGGTMRADADRDGRVSRDEFMADARQRFDRRDGNHDGYLDRADRPTPPVPGQ